MTANKSLLSRMAGSSDEDELMLKDLLGEYGVSSVSELKSFFKLTLEKFKEINENQKKFEEDKH